MHIDIRQNLPSILPKAIAWAEIQQAEILKSGTPLDANQLALARAAGVAHPERIRLVLTDRIPQPDDPLLNQTANELGLLSETTLGVALGYGIFIKTDCLPHQILSHECRHVFQYEQAGSLAAFITEYLRQFVMFGYRNAPFEIDARQHSPDREIGE